MQIRLHLIYLFDNIDILVSHKEIKQMLYQNMIMKPMKHHLKVLYI